MKKKKIDKVGDFVCIPTHLLAALLSEIGIHLAVRNYTESLLGIICLTWKASTFKWVPKEDRKSVV